MHKNGEIFSEEYAIKAVTDTSPESTEETHEEQVKADEERYGVSKPFRIVIKARIARDES